MAARASPGMGTPLNSFMIAVKEPVGGAAVEGNVWKQLAQSVLAALGIAPGGIAGQHRHGAALRLHPPGTLRPKAGSAPDRPANSMMQVCKTQKGRKIFQNRRLFTAPPWRPQRKSIQCRAPDECAPHRPQHSPVSCAIGLRAHPRCGQRRSVGGPAQPGQAPSRVTTRPALRSSSSSMLNSAPVNSTGTPLHRAVREFSASNKSPTCSDSSAPLFAVHIGGAAQHRADARHQFARIERLGHVVVGADFQPKNPVHGFSPRGEQKHRNP